MSHNTLMHQAVRPLVRGLAGTGVRPNHLTALRIATALCAAACFSLGSANALFVGCLIFICSAVLDRADGEMARQTQQFSVLGHWLDLTADCTANALAFVALGIGAWSGQLGGWAPCLGCAAGASVVWLFWQLNAGGDRTAPPPIRSIDPDDAMFLVPILVAGFGASLTIVLAGSITPVVALYAVWRGLKL